MKFLSTLLIVSFTLSMLNGQELFPYQFSLEQGEYKDLENPISLTNGEVWDDPEFTVPLGFDFEFLGQTVETLSTNDNFSGAMLYAGIGTSEGLNLILPYYSDIMDRGALVDSSQSEINYEIVGESPNKIAKIEWKNVGFYDEIAELFTNTSYANFQMWIYEGSGIIEIIFGQSDINTKVAHEFGGASLGIAKHLNFSSGLVEISWNLHGNPYQPEIDELKNASLDNTTPKVMIADPKDGTVYRFVPKVISKTKHVEKLQSVSIYPTLIEDHFFIENNSDKGISIKIFNAIGAQIMSEQVAQGSEQIDLSQFGAGLYYISLLQGDLIASQKLVKL